MTCVLYCKNSILHFIKSISLAAIFVFHVVTTQPSLDVNRVGIVRAPKPHEPIIVVGGGLAGLSAALEAFRNGADVILIDKEKDVGGNSAKASSGISACNTQIQKNLGIEDTIEKCYSDTLAAGDRENDASLADVLVHNSADAVDFLIEHGVNLTDVNLCGGHSVPRLHWISSPKEGKPLPVGVAIIRALKTRLIELQEKHSERIVIRLNTTVVGLVTWNEYVTGVRFRNDKGLIEELSGKSVILATGGFSNDYDNETSLLNEFAEKYVLNLPSTNGAFATGDGVKMARAMGAAIIGMKYIQVHPTAFIDPKNPGNKSKFLAAEALRGKGAILLNEQGKRFGNELGRRDYLTQKIRQFCIKNDKINNWHISFMLMNEETVEAFGRPAFNFYSKIKNFFTKIKNVEKLAEFIKCDVDTLKATLTEYNKLVNDYTAKKTVKDQFGKSVFPVAFQLNKPFYVALTTPAIHYTMGGLKIDRQAFVFSEFMEKPFKGLLAAGEVSGGVHGRNRLAGNSLLECVVFGRIAGQSAAGVSYSSHDEL